MSGSDRKVFDRDVMIDIFERVGEICQARDIYIEIAVYGGSSIMIQPSLFDASRLTDDIDYVQLQNTPQRAVIDSIFSEATESLGYGPRVFRDDVAMLVSDRPGYDFFAHYPKGSGHFRVFTCSAEYLLAMKARSMRSGIDNRDAIDFFNLAVELGVDNKSELEAIVDRYFPGEPLSREKELRSADILDYKKTLADPRKDKDDRQIRYIAR